MRDSYSSILLSSRTVLVLGGAVLLQFGLPGCDSHSQAVSPDKALDVAAASPSPTAASFREPSPLEKDLFSSLDLTTPGLEAVKAAVEKGDYDGATKAFASYLRQRTNVTWTVKPAAETEPDLKVANDAVAGTLQGGYVQISHTFPDGKVDWFYDPTGTGPENPKNNEWQWQLNRMMFWDALGDAYAVTKDEKYARTFAEHLRSWTAQCLVPNAMQVQAGSAWRPIEAGIRMANAWPAAYQRFLQSPSVTDADLVTYAHSVLDHGRYLRKFAAKEDGNHLTMGMSGLYSAGAFFPEFKESADWRKFAVDTLAKDAAVQFLPDGGQFELTPGYHNVALDNFLKIVDVAKMTGRANEIPPVYWAMAEKAYDYNLALMTPDRLLPCFNDSWPVSAGYIYSRASVLFPDRKDFLWALTNGDKGAPPTFTSKFLDWSGYAIMRSGWERNANYLVFDIGPAGHGHIHQDKLGVVLWAWGRRLLMDVGGGSYEKSKWRAWSISTAAQNCVVIDGLSQNIAEEWKPGGHSKDARYVSQQPIDAGWISTPEYDYAKGTYDGEFTDPPDKNSIFFYPRKSKGKIATQTREVFFLKPDIYVIRDTAVPNDDQPHTAQARWHLASVKTAYDAATGAVVTQDPGKANLAVIPLLREGLEVRTASAQEEPEILGWDVRKDQTPSRIPATTILQTRQGTGRQEFLTLLLPIRPGAENPVESISETAPFEIRLKDGRRFQVIAETGSPLKVVAL